VLPWLKRNLFSSWLNGVVSVALLGLLLWLAVRLAQWLVLGAQWSGSGPEACANTQALCWPFVRARWPQFLYGLYPSAEIWRVNLGLALGAALGAALAVRRLPGRRWIAAFLLLAYPPLAGWLFRGGVAGLAPVDTSLWGGFFLTLVVTGSVFWVSLAAGVLLALGRQSRLPLLRQACTVWIEFWRAITSNFIGLFKETTVLLVIGLFDLLGEVQRAASDPQWLGTGTTAAGYLFVAVFFWFACFSLSRASARLERRMTRYRRPAAN